MALSTYSELQTAIKDECIRPEWTTAILQDLIKRAEAKLNRLIPAIQTDASLTGTSGSREVSTSALSIRNVDQLWLTDDGDEEELFYRSPENLRYDDDTREPTEWTWDQTDDKILFNTKLDQAYPFRLLYVQRFALSDVATTNWLLTNHSDVYLAAGVAEGWRRMRDYAAAREYDMMTRQYAREIKNELAKSKRGLMAMPSGLMAIGPGAWTSEGDD